MIRRRGIAVISRTPAAVTDEASNVKHGRDEPIGCGELGFGDKKIASRPSGLQGGGEGRVLGFVPGGGVACVTLAYSRRHPFHGYFPIVSFRYSGNLRVGPAARREIEASRTASTSARPLPTSTKLSPGRSTTSHGLSCSVIQTSPACAVMTLPAPSRTWKNIPRFRWMRFESGVNTAREWVDPAAASFRPCAAELRMKLRGVSARGRAPRRSRATAPAS